MYFFQVARPMLRHCGSKHQKNEKSTVRCERQSNSWRIEKSKSPRIQEFKSLRIEESNIPGVQKFKSPRVQESDNRSIEGI